MTMDESAQGGERTVITPHFNDLFANRARKMKASEIRELLKLTQRPEIISFAGGLPNPQAFPVDRIKEIACELIETNPGRILQYGSTEGVVELREQIAKRLKRVWNIDGDEDNVVVTVGSQQGLDLLGRLFIGSTSIILMEAPTYLGALNAFRVYEPTIVSIPLDENGLDIDALEDNLNALQKHGANLKFLYTVPTFHNPAGVCMSGARRKRLIDLAHDFDLLLVEDDPYGELRYTGDPLPTLKSMDKEDRVIYLGTFSKTLVPGFRIAWTFGPKPVIQKMVVAKQAVDLCTPPFTQHIAMEYLRRGYIDEHLVKIIDIYGRKQKIMLKAMDDFMPKEYISWTKPDGGMFLWAKLTTGIDASEMFQDAISRNVAYVTGSSFFADGSGQDCMRINFTHPEDERIIEGVKRLSEVIEKWGGEKKATDKTVKREVITGV
jgi:2-aminoadipate transaminase